MDGLFDQQRRKTVVDVLDLPVRATKKRRQLKRIPQEIPKRSDSLLFHLRHRRQSSQTTKSLFAILAFLLAPCTQSSVVVSAETLSTPSTIVSSHHDTVPFQRSVSRNTTPPPPPPRILTPKEEDNITEMIRVTPVNAVQADINLPSQKLDSINCTMDTAETSLQRGLRDHTSQPPPPPPPRRHLLPSSNKTEDHINNLLHERQDQTEEESTVAECTSTEEAVSKFTQDHDRPSISQPPPRIQEAQEEDNNNNDKNDNMSEVKPLPASVIGLDWSSQNNKKSPEKTQSSVSSVSGNRVSPRTPPPPPSETRFGEQSSMFHHQISGDTGLSDTTVERRKGSHDGIKLDEVARDPSSDYKSPTTKEAIPKETSAINNDGALTKDSTENIEPINSRSATEDASAYNVESSSGPIVQSKDSGTPLEPARNLQQPYRSHGQAYGSTNRGMQKRPPTVPSQRSFDTTRLPTSSQGQPIPRYYKRHQGQTSESLPGRPQQRPQRPPQKPYKVVSAQSPLLSQSFKTFWGKMERSLEVLGDSVNIQRNRLVQNVSPVVSDSMNAAKMTAASIPRSHPAKRPPPKTTSTPLKPYGTKYQVAMEENRIQKEIKEHRVESKDPKMKPSDWNSLVLSAGGAMSPHNRPSNGSNDVLSEGSTSGDSALYSPVNKVKLQTAINGCSSRPNTYEKASASTNANGQQFSRSGSMNRPINPSAYTPARDPPFSADSRGISPMITEATISPKSARSAPPSATSFLDDDEEDDRPGWKRALQKLVPPIPRIGKLFKFGFGRSNKYHYANMDAWNSDEDDNDNGSGFRFSGLFRNKKAGQITLTPSSSSHGSGNQNSDTIPPSIANLLARCDHGKTASLLRDVDRQTSRLIGRYLAVFDITFLALTMFGVQQLAGFDQLLPLPNSWDGLISVTLPQFGSILNQKMMGTWAFFAFLYAYLSRYARDALLQRRIERLSSSVAESVKEESEYAQLYLRLVAAVPLDDSLPLRLANIAKSQVASVVAKSRLRFYVTIVLSLLACMTLSFIGPILSTMVSTSTQILTLQGWRSWPIPWKSLQTDIATLLKGFFVNLEGLGARELEALLTHPKQFAFYAAVVASQLACAELPRLEEKRIIPSSLTDDDEVDEDMAGNSMEYAEEWSRVGTSSASRLTMLSENGSVEYALERWKANRMMTMDTFNRNGASMLLVLRLIGYALIGALFAVIPLVVSHYLVGQIPSLSSLPVPKWDSMIDLSFIQIFLLYLVYQALWKVVDSADRVSFVQKFLRILVQTKAEMEDSNKRQTDLQLMASLSASAGLIVRDMWAAHTTKRAWAVRGASLQCKNGEVLLVLGENGEGKTRLLTSLAETLMFPPKRSLTTNKVRGYVAVGGLEASKWDRKMLKRRMGILLSDVRMTADSASLFSGWTMEEILEPVDHRFRSSSQNDLLQRRLTAGEKSSIVLALKITGLYTTLLPKLPSKLSTIFTANEEDLRPSSLKPRAMVLSPGEWSKLILTRVLAQSIYDNDNAMASSDKMENCLVGSVLLLDEPTVYLSEVEEGKLIQDLRRTGAATILTSNKWATGRFADRICVLKDGMVVESGSHAELLNRGPQQSFYAAKWQAMTMQ